jgi:hypothetical protein
MGVPSPDRSSAEWSSGVERKRGILARYFAETKTAWSGFWTVFTPIGAALALVVAYYQYKESQASGSMDTAWGIYREVDHAWKDYAKLCLEYPRLDCYSEPNPKSYSLSDDEKNQQRMLYDILTDVFESAYVHFVKFRRNIQSEEGRILFQDQWDGWDVYIGKFMSRPAYLAVWLDIHKEYDDEMQCHIKEMIKNHSTLPSEEIEEGLRRKLDDWVAYMDDWCAQNIVLPSSDDGRRGPRSDWRGPGHRRVGTELAP